ncbi:tRNA 2-thiocytidine(32) synthetase TtcA [Deinococcus maricopensis]|uniref:tRNA-cytidine(32) 2-sulfurtransferase n=1 Tax=Deinococcus maricopensis (strain DSM 21211 / LMG 22137 / NRRL B-23946 / LB-34) TaxID=709986 RepID=E8U6F5_DEIML|nr:tRNA 2-thiocytidine(32) synthetase TtcA [Deinococcus maricopensis]ADV66644.1 tRNA 2-thiocytidine biosynthesis protein TtcA [Deinococcus maricopensis DSM 21211]
MTHTTQHLFAPLVKGAAQAITDYRMIEDGDTVMVCLSGGKDSYTLLDILLHLQKRAPIDFRLIAVNLDQGQPGFPKHVLPQYLTALGVEHQILEQDTYSVVKDKTPEGKTTCSLCSRLRRGILYTHAKRIGATKIALGHHRDDILETLFMNMFFGARLKAMPPKLQSDDGGNVVIRPLAYVAERDIQRYADAAGYPIIPCNLCGSQENLQRKIVGEMLEGWERAHPGRLQNVLRSLTRVTPSHLLDRELYDFASLSATPAEGDRGFDHEEYPEREFLAGLQEMTLLI